MNILKFYAIMLAPVIASVIIFIGINWNTYTTPPTYHLPNSVINAQEEKDNCEECE